VIGRSVERLDELLAEPVGVRSVALLRLLAGPITLLHLWPFPSDAVRGDTFHDRFHHPYVAWLPVPGPGVYTALLVLGAVAAVAMTAGWMTRLATATTFVVVAANLLQSTTHMHNNRAYLVAVLFLLALTPCGDDLSIDAWRRHTDDAVSATMPGWPLWLLRFECALVYGASGFSKLVDPDWFGGSVTWDRVVNQEAMVRASVLPDFVADILLDRSFHTVAAKFIVLTELFIAAGLWWRRSRPFAVAAAVVFHLMIEVSARVQIFSYLGIAVLIVWADPSLTRPSFLAAGARRRSWPSANQEQVPA
jgi:hypothetical protein